MKDRLEALLLQAAVNSGERLAFYRTFLEWELVVPGTTVKDIDGSLDDMDSGETLLHLRYLESEGRQGLPVFSSLDKFHQVMTAEAAYIKVNTRLLLEMTGTDDPWLLNPGFVPSKTIIPEELEALQDGTIMDYGWSLLSEQAQREWLERHLAPIPDERLAEIRAHLASCPAVGKAYLIRTYQPSMGREPNVLIGLELDGGDRMTNAELIRSLNESLAQRSHAQLSIDWVVLDEADSLSQMVYTQHEPFYTRTVMDDPSTLFR